MFTSLKELALKATEKDVKISEIVIENESEETEVPREELILRMSENLRVMREASVVKKQRSASGLCGENAYNYSFSKNKGSLLSDISSKAMEYAMSIAEHNACMGKIVAAPTAGSCGILPAVLLAVSEEKNIPDEDVVKALFNAAGIGQVIAEKSCLAGAEGGCQAECGSASAMAASAVVELMGGTPEMCINAAALTIKFILGLVCDPVKGLVEVPCVKRNASGAINALTAAELSLCGVKSFIPADEVIEAMNEVGKMMNYRLKETALGGLAATETAKKLSHERKENCDEKCSCNKG